MDKIILLGAGGHCKSVIDAIHRQGKFEIYCLVDDVSKIGQELLGYKIQYSDDELQILYDLGIRYAFITVGGIGDTSIRQKIYSNIKKIGFEIPIISDTSAVISKYSIIGEGVFIGKQVVINAGVEIGKLSIINTGSILEHDIKIGNFASIAPAVALSGGACIDDYTHIGTNCTVIENIHIGKNCLIGAGSVVTKDIKDFTKAYGNPCREVSKWKNK